MRPWSFLTGFLKRYETFTLANQFLIAAAIVLSVAMAILGEWITRQIAAITLKSAAISSSVFVESFLQPSVQELSGRALPAEAKARLDKALRETPLGDRLVSVKIWLTDGTVVYATHHEIEGEQFPVEDVERAAKGEVVARYDELEEDESAFEQGTGLPLIEVYAPLTRVGTKEVIAVGEYYEHAPWFSEQLHRAKNATWVIVGATTAAMLAILFLIVRRGSETITSQRGELEKRVRETERLAAQNEELRVTADRARVDANESNEQLIARVGSDLHDGPIQLLSMLMLKLSTETKRESGRRGGSAGPGDAGRALLQITGDVLNELRSISTGLSLPEIDTMTLSDALQLAVSRHEDMTGAKVKVQMDGLPADLPLALKICAYRIVQEALNNSYKHAGSLEPDVTAFRDGDSLVISVADAGDGFDTGRAGGGGSARLGLTGIRNRVSAHRGTLKIDSKPGEGTRITAVLPTHP